jgi:small-conductance mechanosensitive channel
VDGLILFFNQNSKPIITTVLIITVLYLIKIILTSISERRIKVIRKRYLVRQTISYLAYIIMFFAVLIIWFEWLSNFLTFLSLVTGAIIIASKEIVQNIFANVVIITRELFQVGDRIQIGDSQGDVIETGPFYVTIAEVTNLEKGEEPTGRILKIPNNFVFTKSLANYSKNFGVIWNEININVGINSDISVLNNILMNILEKYSYKFDERSKQKLIDQHGEIIFTRTQPSIYLLPSEDH